jgi:ribose 5-phosphate isomerase A
LGAATSLRTGPDGSPYITDGGDLILDCDFGELDDAAPVDRALCEIVGVIETGYFIGRADVVLLASEGGVQRLERG